MKTYIENTLLIIELYLAFGLLFSLLFFWKGIVKIDINTKDISGWTKLLLLPAISVFWVFFLKKWIKASYHDTKA